MARDDSWVGDAQPYLAPCATGEADAWTVEAAARGRRGGQRLLGVEEVEPPEPVREFFGIGAGERVIVRRRPIELADSYYPASIAAGTPLAVSGKIRGGAVTLLAELGHPPRRFADEVSAEIATEEEALALELPRDMPVLLTFRVVYSDGGRPIEVSLLAKAGHRYRMRYELGVD